MVTTGDAMLLGVLPGGGQLAARAPGGGAPRWKWDGGREDQQTHGRGGSPPLTRSGFDRKIEHRMVGGVPRPPSSPTPPFPSIPALLPPMEPPPPHALTRGALGTTPSRHTPAPILSNDTSGEFHSDSFSQRRQGRGISGANLWTRWRDRPKAVQESRMTLAYNRADG